MAINILEESREFGMRMAHAVSAGVYRNPELGARETVGNIAMYVGHQSRSSEEPVDFDWDLRRAYEAYAFRFLKDLQRRPRWADVPVLMTEANEFGEPVPIDESNERGRRSLAALARRRLSEAPDRGTIQNFADRIGGWRRMQRLGAPIGFQRLERAVETFFGLLTASMWRAGQSFASSRGGSSVTYTVDCANYGYQLEFWPQFYFSPTVFGGNLTRPVTANVTPNHYHFQGWMNGVVVQDGGVHVASAKNTKTILRAF